MGGRRQRYCGWHSRIESLQVLSTLDFGLGLGLWQYYLCCFREKQIKSRNQLQCSKWCSLVFYSHRECSSVNNLLKMNPNCIPEQITKLPQRRGRVNIFPFWLTSHDAQHFSSFHHYYENWKQSISSLNLSLLPFKHHFRASFLALSVYANCAVSFSW